MLPIILVLGSMCTPKKDLSNTVQNPYFAQLPPGDTAEIFGEGIISLKGRYEFGISFSPKGDEIIYGAMEEQKAILFYTKNIEGVWATPKKISLSQGAFSDEMEAFFTPDGKHIYFAPYNEGLYVSIWGVDITEEGWVNPRAMDTIINSGPTFFPVCAANNNMYYANIGKRKIFKANYENNKYTSVEETGFPFGMHCYIAPDESYALIDGRHESSIGKGDIYVVFKKTDGQWDNPINLGSRVNSEYSETCPALSHDGKYIFFSRYNDENEMSDFYWVSSSILEQYKPDHKK